MNLKLEPTVSLSLEIRSEINGELTEENISFFEDHFRKNNIQLEVKNSSRLVATNERLLNVILSILDIKNDISINEVSMSSSGRVLVWPDYKMDSPNWRTWNVNNDKLVPFSIEVKETFVKETKWFFFTSTRRIKSSKVNELISVFI